MYQVNNGMCYETSRYGKRGDYIYQVYNGFYCERHLYRQRDDYMNTCTQWYSN